MTYNAHTELPPGWRSPTPETLAEYEYGLSSGLVPPWHDVLRTPADPVPEDEVGGWQASRILEHMYEVVQAMHDRGRKLVGLAAPQVGEAAQIVLVPNPFPGEEDGIFDKFMPVFNPNGVVDESVPRKVVPHGCFSSNETFVRLPSAEALDLSGLNRHGEPLHTDEYGNPAPLRRTGFDAVVDEHELRHLGGIRAADIALRKGLQIDWRPPERAEEYREYFNSDDPNSRSEWHLPYPHEQWQAVKSGDFRLDDF